MVEERQAAGKVLKVPPLVAEVAGVIVSEEELRENDVEMPHGRAAKPQESQHL